eukprot:TRINITY_DN430_c0_g1_i1.p1 TRINITY_DN430_c0_g1~~TRINITY_DN430_c0_g1_i1.p1  ORF type:complete len:462 (+),score=34.89 TRINITY_DN430_c0_g1_i1:136-1386(+)
MCALALFSVIALACAQDLPDLPQQIHLAFSAAQNEMVVTWYRKEEGLTQIPFVMYGLESGIYGWNVTGIFYPHSKASGWSGTLHTATMTGLNPDTKYFYRCGDVEKNLWSAEFSFHTPLPKGPAKSPSRFAVYGDMGLGGNSSVTVKSIVQMQQNNMLDVVLHVGDISYCDTDDETKGDQSTWSAFMNEIQPIAANTPYMTCPGNHDVFYEKKPYEETFPMPYAKNGVYWYTFDYQNIRFISFSTEDWFLPLSPQRDWLVSELKKYSTEPNAPSWLIVYAHRPIYCSNAWEWCKDDIERWALKESIANLLQDYKVDIFIAGHTHSYERSYPVYDNKVKGSLHKPQATVHLTIGTPGDQEGLDWAWQHPAPEWSAFRKLQLGWGLMTVHNDTHIQWQFVESATSKTLDEFWLTKGKW